MSDGAHDGAHDGEDPAVRRAEELVDRLVDRVARSARLAVARAREEAEDVWAEARERARR